MHLNYIITAMLLHYRDMSGTGADMDKIGEVRAWRCAELSSEED